MTATLTYDQRVAVARLQALLELLPTSLDKQLAAAGLTAFEFSLLDALVDSPDHRLRLSALASKTNATLPRLSRVVTGLESKGLVIRSACSQDGRATNAVLTDAGRARHGEALPLHEAAVRSLMLADLTDADVIELARLTYLMLARLDPDGRLAVTAQPPGSCSADPTASPHGSRPSTASTCAADPVGPTASGSSGESCAADPKTTPCPTDPPP